MTVTWVSALTIALVLLLVFGYPQDVMVDPGKLAIRHVAIKDCKACHIEPDHRGLTNMVEAAFFDKPGTRLNPQCLSCHEMDPAHADFAHNVPKNTLQKITGQINAKTPQKSPLDDVLSVAFVSNQHLRYEKVSCAVCHQDHKGLDFDMTAMNLKQCNSCHVQNIKTLEKDHPKFDSYPHKRRTHIIYDHITHLNDYFIRDSHKERAPESCLSCHAVLEDKQPTLLTGYENTCAECHDIDIAGATQDGLAIFAIPRLDLKKLIKADRKIGEWPEDTEALITPFMRVLLATDERYQAFVKLEKEESLDLADLEGASAEALQCVEDLAWSIKELLYDLNINGPKVIKDRLEAVMTDKEILSKSLVKAVSMLPVDSFRKAQTQWLPNLIEEVDAYKEGQSLETKVVSDSQTVAIETGLEKEVVENEKVQTSVIEEDLGFPPRRPGDRAKQNEEVIVDDGSDDLDDWLNDEFTDETLEESDEKEIVLLSAREWMQRGGWFYDFDSLNYRPTGHADSFVKTWADLMRGERIADDYKGASNQVFERLMLGGKDSLGACSKCHSVDRKGGDYFTHWMKANPKNQGKRFTKFSHQIHVELTGKENCRQCHIRKKESMYAAGFEDFDPTIYTSNYLQIQKDACTSCHNDQLAQDSCQTCHNYHIQDWSQWAN